MKSFAVISAIIIIALLGFGFFIRNNEFNLPSGETRGLDYAEEDEQESSAVSDSRTETDLRKVDMPQTQSRRKISVTDGVKHSIPLNEILSGGPGKDGIPSIDDPKFISATGASFLSDDDPGLGLSLGGETRFYPYRILVWHEIVNDTVAGNPVLITYCPLCATGIVFERLVGGEPQEFGVSGRLWQSNLLMYNRAGDEKDESLWSQVLGEAVLGVETGMKLSIIRSDVARWGDWKKAHPETQVLSQDTGSLRDYGRDPYGDYYTSQSVSFGATFSDTRLHPKALVHGIEIDGKFKAYDDAVLKKSGGNIKDAFAGRDVVIIVSESGELLFTADGEPLSSIPGFWFSWLAVHPETELFK